MEAEQPGEVSWRRRHLDLIRLRQETGRQKWAECEGGGTGEPWAVMSGSCGSFEWRCAVRKSDVARRLW